MRGKDGFSATVYASVWCHDILVMAPEIWEGRMVFWLYWCLYFSLCLGLVPRDPGHGTRDMRGKLLVISANLQYNKTWCHETMILAPEIWEGILYKFILMFMSVFQSSTELAHAGYIYIYIYIYSVLCTFHCVVFYNVPPLTGQVLGKVLLTSWEIN